MITQGLSKLNMNITALLTIIVKRLLAISKRENPVDPENIEKIEV